MITHLEPDILECEIKSVCVPACCMLDTIRVPGSQAATPPSQLTLIGENLPQVKQTNNASNTVKASGDMEVQLSDFKSLKIVL